MASTIVDELIVRLNLDPNPFKKGEETARTEFKKTGEAARKQATDFEKQSRDTKSSVSGLTQELLGFYAVLKTVTGFKDFLAGLVTSGVGIGRFADMTGQSVTELGAWRNLAERAGGSAEGITQSMLGLTQQMQQFSVYGNAGAIPFLRALGIHLNNANGSIKTAGQLLLDLAGNPLLHQMPRTRASFILTQLGLDPFTQGLILQGRAKLAALLADAKKIAPSDADVKAAQAYTDALNRLQQQAGQTGRALLTDLGPPLLFLLNVLSKSVELTNALLRIPSDLIQGNPHKAGHILENHFRIRDGQLEVSVAGFGPQSGTGTRRSGGTGAALPSGGLDLLGLVRRLEDSGAKAVSKPVGGGHGGAIGVYQILPSTALLYGRDPSRLTDPKYNEDTARIILADLSRKYRGNLADILIGYNSNPAHVAAFNRSGGNLNALLPETQRYLLHAQRLGALSGGAASAAASQIRVTQAASVAHHTHHVSNSTDNSRRSNVTIQNLTVQGGSANETGSNVARAIEGHLFAVQANSGQI